MEGSANEVKRTKWLEDTDRDAVIALKSVLTREGTAEDRRAEEALRNFEENYGGDEGNGFVVKDKEGKINGCISYKKDPEKGIIVDQIRVDPNAPDVSAVIRSLVEGATKYAGKDGSFVMTIEIADSSEFIEVLKDKKLGFDEEGTKGEMITLKKRVH